MTRKLLFALYFVLILTAELFSATTRISGTVENADDFTIRLKSFTDYISYRDTILAEVLIDKNAHFDFSLDIEHPIMVTLKLGFQSASFYIEPDRIYTLRVFYDPEKEQLSYLAKYQLLLEFVDIPTDDLNNLLSEFNRISDQFLIKNYSRIYRSRQFDLIDSLRYQALAIGKGSSDYFTELVDFRLADMLLTTQGQETEKLFFKYFGNKPVRYDNYEYMVFFNTFFHGYIKTKTKVLQPDELLSLINKQDNIEALSNVLKKDMLLLDNRLRELVILRALYYFFYDFDFEAVKVIHHLKYIEQYSPYKEHRLIAKNIVKKITALQPGSPIPDFNFTDLNGVQKTNNDYKGKYLLLSFWELDCSDCFKSIDSLEYLQRNYADRMNVVAVSGSNYVSDLRQMLKEREYTMGFLLSSPDNRVYDDLKIRSLPAAILLNELGMIVLYPAILPGRGYKNTFKAVFKK